MSTVLLAGVVALALGGALSGIRHSPSAGLWLQAVGAALVGIAGFWAFASGSSAGSAFTSSLEPHLGLDPLSGVFLGMLGLVGAPALAYATAYLTPGLRGRAVAVLTSAFVITLTEVLCARDALSFLLGWELMTLVPAAIILVGRSDATARRTVFVYVAITHLGGAGVWIALLLLADHAALGGGEIDPSSGLYIVIALASVVGFGTKAGVLPFHAWLPRAHPIAPAPVSALMSGVMVKVGLYGLIRVLVEWLGVPQVLGALVLALGAASAVGGIVYALFQRDLKKLLAFSTIDNVGIALLGVGACLLFRAHGEDAWAALALGAALLHAINHAVFKGLLFLGAGSLERATGSVDLDGLGGMLRRAPWTGWAILIGCGAIAGLPPLNGFASEWLTAQSLLRLPVFGGVRDGTLGAIALAALAATAALAVYCFVKVAGQALLGTPSRTAVVHAKEVPLAMHGATTLLAVVCVGLGLAPGPLYERLVDLAPGSQDIELTAGVVVPGSGGLPTPTLALALVLFATAFALARRNRSAEPAPTWACGQEVVPALTWTSAGFTKSLRLVLEALLRPEREITVRTQGGVVQSASYTGRVPHLVDERLYRPTTNAALKLASVARRLQSGRLGTYVAYLVGLVIALLLAIKIGALG